uniref:Uncharacterized protein n=1 Tax=Parastrongyloides trichosuri TaxID=131310 RepID=A0A0N5A2L2_PARTI
MFNLLYILFLFINKTSEILLFSQNYYIPKVNLLTFHENHNNRVKRYSTSRPYKLPGNYEPLPGRSYETNYMPIFPFGSQFSSSIELDPDVSRDHTADIWSSIPSWGVFDFKGRINLRAQKNVAKTGYFAHPVNMLGLTNDDMVHLLSSPQLEHNRNQQPTIPMANAPTNYAPLNCKPPLCNPYTESFGFGSEFDFGGNDGFNGNFDLPIPISKNVAFRLPVEGNFYNDVDNLTVTYGHSIGQIDPYKITLSKTIQ